MCFISSQLTCYLGYSNILRAIQIGCDATNVGENANFLAMRAYAGTCSHVPYPMGLENDGGMNNSVILHDVLQYRARDSIGSGSGSWNAANLGLVSGRARIGTRLKCAAAMGLRRQYIYSPSKMCVEESVQLYASMHFCATLPCVRSQLTESLSSESQSLSKSAQKKYFWRRYKCRCPAYHRRNRQKMPNNLLATPYEQNGRKTKITHQSGHSHNNYCEIRTNHDDIDHHVSSRTIYKLELVLNGLSIE